MELFRSVRSLTLEKIQNGGIVKSVQGESKRFPEKD